MVILLDKVPADRARSFIVAACDTKCLTSALAAASASLNESLSRTKPPPSSRAAIMTAESTSTGRSIGMKALISSKELHGSSTRIKPSFVESDFGIEKSNKWRQEGKQPHLEPLTDTTPGLGVSPTSVSLMSLTEGMDARALLKQGLGTDSDHAMHALHVPVWTGRISMGVTIQDDCTLRRRRDSIEARIIISAPENVPFDQSRALQGRFECEPFDQRMTSLALSKDVLCWGKILPSREADIPVLTKLVIHLLEGNLVAVPPAYRQHHAYHLMYQNLDVFIVTTRQALRAGCPIPDEVLRTSSSLENELLCYGKASERPADKQPDGPAWANRGPHEAIAVVPSLDMSISPRVPTLVVSS